MVSMWASALCLILLVCVNYSQGYGEPFSNGRPVYMERASHFLVNAARMSPSDYKTVYMSGYSPSPASIMNMGAQGPIYLDANLSLVAYEHSYEMATKNYFAHNSYDNTSFSTRVWGRYSNKCGGIAENIAAGQNTSVSASNTWLCDAYNGACAADGTSNAGHRTNIMSPNYKSMGVGYAYTTTSGYKHYWTQDFGGGTCTAYNSPIFAGTHIITYTTSSIKYAAIWYNAGVTPTSASVVVAGTSYALTKEVGSTDKGSYAYSMAAGSGCRSYYFLFVASGVTYRYPDTGCLVTTNPSSSPFVCTTEFDASCPSTTVGSATTGSATSGSTTTGTASTPSPTAPPTTPPAATSPPTTPPTSAPVTTTGSSSTTGSAPSAHYIFSNSLQNSWTKYGNSGVTINTAASYGGQTVLSAALTNSNSYNDFFWFTRSSTVTISWTNLVFKAAASRTTTQAQIYFNGLYLNTKTFTTTLQEFTISKASLGASNTVGDKQLIFASGETTAITYYIYDVRFV